MKKYLILLVLAVSFVYLQHCNAKTSDFFNYVLHDNLSLDDISQVREKLDGNIYRLIDDFELDANSIGKINVHIWHVKEHFLDAMERNIGFRYEQAKGYLNYSNIYVLLIDNPLPMINYSGLLYNFSTEEIAEHELAHCLSLRVNSSFSNNPRWFWETVAIYESNEFYNPNDLDYLKSGKYPTINELNRGFESGDYRIYQVGYLIGEYIIFEWGKSGFIKLIKENGDIENVFGISIDEFEVGWQNFVDAKYFNANYSNMVLNDDALDVIYNPENEHVIVNYGDYINAEITIYNIHGQKVYMAPSGTNNTYIDVSGFKSGGYLIQLRIDGRYATKKIMIK